MISLIFLMVLIFLLMAWGMDRRLDIPINPVYCPPKNFDKMYLPFLFDSWASATLYLLLTGVFTVGIWQSIQIKSGKVESVRSLAPLGGVAVCIGFIGNFIKITGAFEAIEAAGDINPQIVAAAIKEGPPYIILGFVILAVAFVFKYVNQR